MPEVVTPPAPVVDPPAPVVPPVPDPPAPAPPAPVEPPVPAPPTPPPTPPPATPVAPPAAYELTVAPEDAALAPHQIERERFEAVARASGWSQAEAAEEFAAGIAVKREISAALLESQRAELAADAEFGGDKGDASRAAAMAVINDVYPEGHARRAGLLSFLERSDSLNNIHVRAFLATLATKTRREDQPPSGQTTGAPATQFGDGRGGDVMFPKK